MRLGSHMKALIRGKLEPWQVARLIDKARKDVQKALDGVEGLYAVVTALDGMVREGANDVVAKARQGEEKVKVVAVCCHNTQCGLCLGKHQSHYPNFYLDGKKVKDASAFLSRFMEGKDVISFLRLCELRNKALILLNYWQRLSVRLGLLDEEAEEGGS